MDVPLVLGQLNITEILFHSRVTHYLGQTSCDALSFNNKIYVGVGGQFISMGKGGDPLGVDFICLSVHLLTSDIE